MSKKSMAERRQLQSAPRGSGNGRGGQRNGRGSANYRRQKAGAQRPWGLFGAIGGVVAVFVVVILVLVLTAGNGGQDTQVLPAPASVLNVITKLPDSTLNTVGGGAANNPPRAISGYPKLTQSGKPEVLYIGAEYCPYCALQRWSLVGALSRFGTFHNLKIIRASATDPAGKNVATFTFAHGVTYSSPYIAFVAKELYTNVPTTSNPVGYTTFQKLNKEETSLFTNPNLGNGGFPFVYFGGLTAQLGSESTSPGPTGLQGMDWQQIANALKNPKSTPAQMILGGVNYDTAAICLMTGNKPGSVCGQTAVVQLEKNL